MLLLDLAAAMVAPTLAQLPPIPNGSFEDHPFDPAPVSYRYLDDTQLASSLLTPLAIASSTSAGSEPSYLYHASRYPVFDGQYALALNDGDELYYTFFGQPPRTAGRFRFYACPLRDSLLDITVGAEHWTVNLLAEGVDTQVPGPGGTTWRAYERELTVGGGIAREYFHVTLANRFEARPFDVIPLDRVTLDSCLWLRGQLTGAHPCGQSSVTLRVDAVSGRGEPISYQWRRNGADVPGATGAQLVVFGSEPGEYECRVISPSCQTVAGPVLVASCPADLDNGGGEGACDGSITIDDLVYFIRAMAAGDVRADLDDGRHAGDRDGAVTIEDLLYFLDRFALGC